MYCICRHYCWANTTPLWFSLAVCTEIDRRIRFPFYLCLCFLNCVHTDAKNKSTFPFLICKSQYIGVTWIILQRKDYQLSIHSRRCLFQTCGFPSFKIAYCLSFPFVLKIKSLKAASKREKCIPFETNNSPNRKVSFSCLDMMFKERKSGYSMIIIITWYVNISKYQKRFHSI